MRWTRFQKIAFIAFITVELLIFVGASVRASGSGLGCPDWPFCYGRVIPPSSAEEIDFAHLDLEKFRKKAAQHGRDPATITQESLRAEFNPVATWVEYLNRLSSLPVGLSMTLLLIAAFGQIKARPLVFTASLTAFVLVLVNAWLGMRVVLSGLQPGIITLHMALAILLQCVLVYTCWRGTINPWRLAVDPRKANRLLWIGVVLLLLVVAEGIMGSQVREMTDELARQHTGERRDQWVGELEHSLSYILHRSFSWVILGWTLYFAHHVRRVMLGLGWLELSVIGLVFAQMVLGIILAHVGIVRTAQVLHIGLSSLLVSGLFLWILGANRARVASRF